MHHISLLALLIIFSTGTAGAAPPRDHADGPPQSRSAPASDEENCACHDMACLQKKLDKSQEKTLDCAAATAGEFIPLVGPLYELGKLATSFDPSFISTGRQLVRFARDPAENAPQCLKDAVSEIGGLVDKFARWRGALDRLADPRRTTTRDLIALVDETAGIATAADEVKDKAESCDAFKGYQAFKNAKEFLEQLNALRNRHLTAMAPRAAAVKRIPAIGSIVTCTTTLATNYLHLREQGKCLVEDIKALKESQAAVGRTLAQETTRIHNHARYFGCRNCVRDTFSGGRDLDDCRGCCARIGNTMANPGRVPKVNASWVSSCRLTCNVAWTNGFARNYLDERTCAAVKQMSPQARVYRDLGLELAPSSPDRRTAVTARRAEWLATVADLKTMLGSGAADMTWFTGMADRARDPAHRRAAQIVIGRDLTMGGQPYLFWLLDTACAGGANGNITAAKVACFEQELTQYRDDAERP